MPLPGIRHSGGCTGVAWQTHRTVRYADIPHTCDARPLRPPRDVILARSLPTNGRAYCRAELSSRPLKHGPRLRRLLAPRKQGHSMAEAAIAASAAICVAVLGALLSFIYSRQLQRRQARLERLNAQLRDFYGPCTRSSKQTTSPTSDSSTPCAPVAPPSSPPTCHPSTTKNFACGDYGPRALISTDPPQRMR